MCSASKPKVERTAPPPMYIPETTNQEVKSAQTRERRRAAAASGRESTILGGPQALATPTSQSKSLLGT